MADGLRELCGRPVPPIGLGAMNLSHGYGEPPSPASGRQVLQKAIDLGVTHFDTAALYGFGRNEELVGPLLKPYRDRILLASKCGMRGIDGKRSIDGRPEALAKDLEDSLRRLQTEVIDLYYLHRWDKRVPIEESVGMMSRFVEQGKVRAIGLSEVSATTIRKAHDVHPIAAVQSEYSLWSRNVEIAALDTCRDLDIAFVAFSPLARGFLADPDLQPEFFSTKDIRRAMPRFQEPHFSRNATLLGRFTDLAQSLQYTPAQLALAWVLHQAEFIHAIPGTTSIRHLEENFAVETIVLPNDVITDLDALINPSTVSGARYPLDVQREIDTEEF